MDRTTLGISTLAIGLFAPGAFGLGGLVAALAIATGLALPFGIRAIMTLRQARLYRRDAGLGVSRDNENAVGQ